jgi:hypothetical protein
MPSHIEDLPLLPDIQATLTHQLIHYPNHTIIFYRDFNRDIALISSHHDDIHTPP